MSKADKEEELAMLTRELTDVIGDEIKPIIQKYCKLASKESGQVKVVMIACTVKACLEWFVSGLCASYADCHLTNDGETIKTMDTLPLRQEIMARVRVAVEGATEDYQKQHGHVAINSEDL